MILMDTHVFLWFQLGDKKLEVKNINKLIKAHECNELFLSAISIWEIAMLERVGRIAFHQPLLNWFNEATKGINVIPIDTKISLESVMLPNLHHKDPTDRFIIATTRIINCRIMTYDKAIINYAKSGYIKIA